MTPQELEYAVEELVDATTLRDVVQALVAVCHGKAEHLRSNWQDDLAAKAWERDARKLDNLALLNI